MNGLVCTSEQATQREKQDLHPRRILFCIWQNQDDIVYFELLPRNVTVTAELYYEQLRLLHAAISTKNQNEVILEHDNTQLHTANVIQLVIHGLNGKFFRIRLIHQILRHLIFTYFELFQTDYAECPSTMMLNSKIDCIVSLLQNKPGFTNVGPESCRVMNNAGEYIVDQQFCFLINKKFKKKYEYYLICATRKNFTASYENNRNRGGSLFKKSSCKLFR